ncbi:MAG: hypothetical protein JSU66_04725 [Deltaproteobacteria bacterium]|nr:MAG: hypothetical protein JSU66_04725 [Deltaproteobacteria bacterium]
MRVVRLAAISLASAAAAAGLGLFVYANVQLGSARSVDARLDDAIARGLDFLDRGDRFAIGQERGGHPPVEVWLAKKILVHEDHPGFRRDVERGWQLATRGPQGFLTALPGEPPRPLLPADRERIELALKRHWSAGDESHALFGRWVIYALHPRFRDRIPGDFEVLLSETWDVSNGYKLTHRLFTYRLMLALHPELARSLGIPRRAERARRRMVLEMFLDFRLSDLYFERLAFLQESRDAHRIRSRWIERVLLDQNDDGGWAFAPSLACELRRMARLDCARGRSGSHPTFLAVYALVQYRDRPGPPP